MKEKYQAVKTCFRLERGSGLLSALSLNARSKETLLSTSFDIYEAREELRD